MFETGIESVMGKCILCDGFNCYLKVVSFILQNVANHTETAGTFFMTPESQRCPDRHCPTRLWPSWFAFRRLLAANHSS